MDIETILQNLTDLFGSIQDTSWFKSLQKTALSKNITVSDWNSLVYKAAITSNDTEVLKKTLTNAVSNLDTRVNEHAEALDALDGRIDDILADVANGKFAEKLAIPDITEGNNDYPDGIKTLDALVNAITNGTLSQFLTVMRYGEEDTAKTLDKFLLDITKLSDNLTELANNLAEFETDVQLDFDDVRAEFRDASLYRPQGTVSVLPENGMLEGYVYSVEPADGGSFTYDGKEYPFGTNMVYYLDEKGNGKWDSLGGIMDYRDITQWDLIVTSPLNLGTVLESASGNVLVKLDEPYMGTLYATLSDSLKLLDFGGSKFEGVHLIADAGANTVVRNIRSVNNTKHTFERFKLVSNAQGYSKIINCREVENTFITLADTSRHIHNCTATPVSDTAVFGNCTHISDIDIAPLESFPNLKYTIEFYNCHHINNVHCAPNINHGANDIASNIHYYNCTFVDPYTCAGFVQPENSDKVPVPDVAGYTDFKEFAPRLSNDSTRYAAVYTRLKNNGSHKLINVTSGAGSAGDSVEGCIPLRSENGQLEAPNQETYPPSDDQFVSKRFLDAQAAAAQTHLEENYLPIIPNNSAYSQVYSQLPDGKPSRIAASPSSTNKGLIPLRQADGQIKAPDQTVYKPEPDQYISRRYLEANAPSGGGGSKLYRHDININYIYYGGSCIDCHFSLYTTRSTSYTSFYELPLTPMKRMSATGSHDPYDQGMMVESIFAISLRDDGNVWFNTVSSDENMGWGGATVELPSFNYDYSDEYNGAYTFIDNVTEVT